jgi:DNA-directed RNA polymerase specialized sigma subunit
LRLRAELGREATDEEVAAKAKLTLKQVKQAAIKGARPIGEDFAPELQAALNATMKQAMRTG